MPLKIVFLRPQNCSRLKPITKALLPPSRYFQERKFFVSTGSASVLFLAPDSLCQSDLRNLQKLHLHVRNVWGLPWATKSSQSTSYSGQINWSRHYAERIWGEFFILVRRIVGKLPANFSANFAGEFFSLVFPRFQATPKKSRPKFTSRIVGIPLQFHFLEPKIYSRRFSAYGGDQN